MVRGTALLLTALTGFSALVYEVVWQRYLAVLLGSHSEAVAAVLGIFLGGLSLGYALFGRVARRFSQRATQPLRLLGAYALVEAGIGLYALLFPWLFAVARAASLGMPLGSEALAFAADVGLTAVLIAPPAVLMGGTIPLLTQALARGLADATRFHALVYASNTLGAFVGALCAGFFLLPALGLAGAVRAMGWVNLGAGLAFAALDARRRAGEAQTAPAAAPRAERRTADSAAYAAAALLAGFALMTLQTVANRIGGLALGASHFTFASVVATFVLCIAIGSFAVSVIPRIPTAVLPATQWGLVAYLALLYGAVPDSTYWAHVLRARFPSDAASFLPFHFAVLLALLAVLALPLALAGAALPLMFHELRQRAADLGHVAGRLYAWNTVGSLLGALLGGYALLFWLQLHHIYRLSVAALAASAALVSVMAFPRRRGLAGVALLAAVVLVAAQPAWPPERLSAGLFRSRSLLPMAGAGPDAFFARYRTDARILGHWDDPSASVTVRASSSGRSILINGKSDSSIPVDVATTGLLGLLPALLADTPRRAFVIGYGTGFTVGQLASLDSIQEVVVAEISPGVIAAAPLFDPMNGGAFANPKTRIVRGDAYRALSRATGRYDVIVSEPSNPWVVGVELLYTREFLSAVRARLAPGGVFAQWIHSYEMDAETLGSALRTFREVFAGASVWFARGPDLILLGFERRAAIDLARLADRVSQPEFQEGLRACTIRSFDGLLSHELLPVGVLDAADLRYPVHTIGHPILGDLAARAFFRGREAEIPVPPTPRTAAVGVESSLLRRYWAGLGRPPGGEERESVLVEVCRYRLALCGTLLAQWRREDPDDPGLAQLLRDMASSPDHAELARPDRLTRLSVFFGDGDVASLAPGDETVRAFIEGYAYAAPFDLRVLDELRSRCAPSDPRCREPAPE